MMDARRQANFIVQSFVVERAQASAKAISDLICDRSLKPQTQINERSSHAQLNEISMYGTIGVVVMRPPISIIAH